MAMTKLILERHLYDDGFVKNYTRGFEAYESYLKTLSADRLSRYCGIPVQMIEELTRLFVSTERYLLFPAQGWSISSAGRRITVLSRFCGP